MGQKQDRQDAQEFQVSRGYAYYVFPLFFLLYLFNYVDRMIIASLFPYLKVEWNLTDTNCGWFASIVTFMMTAFVFPVSYLVDRWSRKKAIATMAVVWSIATAACALTRNFAQLFTYVGYVGNTFVATALMTWLPSYFNRVDGWCEGCRRIPAALFARRSHRFFQRFLLLCEGL